VETMPFDLCVRDKLNLRLTVNSGVVLWKWIQHYPKIYERVRRRTKSTRKSEEI
jgi:hypothetical protein